MRYFGFEELSFRSYKPITIEVIGGSRPRLTLLNTQDKKKYFLKTYRHNSREVWAEMLASKLGELVEVKVQAVSLKKLPQFIVDVFRKEYGTYLPEDWKPVGALVGNVFPKGHEQLYGSQIIGTASDPVSLNKIEEAIRKTYLDSEDILQRIADMIVFDAWIGNMDRHHENWAVTQTNILQQLGLFRLTPQEREGLKRKRWLTQLFDHGSSLLFELSDSKVKYFLAHKEEFVEQYILGKKYALLLGTNEERLNIFSILRQHIGESSPWRRRLKKSITTIAAADSLKVAQLILQMPTDGPLEYGADRKCLLYFSLEERKKILKDMLLGGVTT